jgi:hypothetical protein
MPEKRTRATEKRSMPASGASTKHAIKAQPSEVLEGDIVRLSLTGVDRRDVTNVAWLATADRYEYVIEATPESPAKGRVRHDRDSAWPLRHHRNPVRRRPEQTHLCRRAAQSSGRAPPAADSHVAEVTMRRAFRRADAIGPGRVQRGVLSVPVRSARAVAWATRAVLAGMLREAR